MIDQARIDPGFGIEQFGAISARYPGRSPESRSPSPRTATAPLNRLFAQGRVAIETLRFDTEAREKFLAELPTDHPADPSFRSPTVVYGVMLKDGIPLTSTSLFAFAKVSLLHAATALQGMGARLEIVSISRTSSTGAAASS